jgi:PAS domain S-box-containing protein
MTNTEEVTVTAQSNGSGVADFDLTQQGAIQILERITDGFISVDREWRVTYINRAGAQIAGRAPAELISKNLWEIYPEAVGTKFQTEYERALRDRASVVFEEYLGSVKLWLEVNAYPSESGLSIFFRDITEKKRISKRLRESEELLQGTINALTGHIAVLDKNGVIVKVNETWRRFAEENLFQGTNYGIGQNYIEACVPNDKEPHECDPHGIEAAEGIRKVANGELELFELEYPCHSPHEQRWFVMRVTRFNETKDDVRVVVAHENVTERKLAENALRESQEQYRTLFNSLDAGFCVCELLIDDNGKPFDYRFLEVNRTFERHTGLKNATGKTALELVPNLEPHWVEIYEKVALKGEPTRFIQGSDVMGRWFDVYAFPAGTPEKLQFGVLFNDITEQKQGAEKLQASEKQLKLVTDAIPALVAYVDEERRYQFANKAYYDWYGQKPEDIIGKTVEEVIGEVAYAKILPEIERVFAGEAFSFERFMPYKAGGSKHIAVNYIPDKDEQGAVKGYYALVQDISERKEREEALRESDTRLRLAIDISRTATFDIDLLTDVVQTDLIGREMYGFAADEPLTFSKVQSRFHPQDREAVISRISAAFAPEGSNEFEVEQRIVRTDGETRWIRVRGRAFFEGEGEARRAVRCLGTYIDITDSKKAESELKQLYERFLIAEKASNGFIYEWDLKTNQVERSSRVSDVLGYSLSEIDSTANAWQEFVHPLDYAQMIDVFQDKLLNGGNYVVTYRVRHKNGHWVYLEDRGLVVRDENGEPERVVGVSVDVTARKEAEATLAESVARYRYTFEQSPVGVLQINADGTLKAVNPAYCKLVGYEAHELVGKSPIEWTPVADHEADRAFRQSFLDNPVQQKSHEKRYIRKDGEIIWIHLTVTGVRDDGGNLFGIGIVQDITERKRAEEKLKESEALFRELSEVLPAGVFIVKEDKHIYANAQAEMITGYAREELLSISPFELTNEAGHEKIREIRQIRLNNPEAATAREMPLITKSGELRWVLSCSTQITLEGETAVLLASFDITDQKRAQEALRESEERLRLATEAAQIYSWEYDLAIMQAKYSANVADVLGFALPEDITAAYELMHPEDRPKAISNFAEGLTGAKPISGEMRFVNPTNGEIVWILSEGTLLYDERNQPVRSVGITQNITERKRSETALRESEERLRLASNAAQMFAWETDLVAGKIKWSENAAHIIGCAPEELTDDTANSHFFIIPEDGERISLEFAKILAEGKSNYVLEFRGKEPKNERRFWQAQGLVIYDEQQKPIRVVGITQNITERKLAEQNAAFLAEIAEDLASLETIGDIMNKVAAKIGSYFNAFSCAFTYLDEAADTAVVQYEWRSENAPSLIGKYRISEMANEIFIRDSRAGKVIVVRDTTTDSYLNSEPLAALGIGSYINVPLIRDGEWQFQFAIHDLTARDWRDEEVALMRELTTRVWTRLERARAEDALRESEERFRNLADSAPVLIWVNDLEGTVYVNRQYLEFVGTGEVKDISKFDWTQFVHPDDYDNYVGGYTRAFERRDNFFAQFRFRRYDGEYRWMTTTGLPRIAASGEFLGYVGSTVDIDDLKRTEEALRESEERFRNMADNAPVMVWVTEKDGYCSFLSKSWYEFTGQTPETGLGFGWLEATHPDDQQKARDLFVEATEQQKPFYIEYRLRRKDGSYAWAIDSAIPRVSPEGEFLGFIGSVIDITERKQAEDALREADRRKDEFLATLAHELRNPLAPIQTALEIMRSGADKEKGQQAREIAARQIEQMRHLIDDLLDISRITQGKIKLKFEEMDLREAIQSAIETSLPLIEASKHQFSASLPDKPIHIRGDAVRLSQIFLNLLNNAAKFTDAGGKVELTAAIEGGEAVVKVKDTGAGIPAEMLEQIFEMFSQVEKTGSRPQGGLGIGLNLVKRLTEKHGGTVTALSEGKNMGSEFTVRLPLAEVPRDEQQENIKQSAPAAFNEPHKLRLLVVDDNADAADMMSFALELEKHTVKTVYNGTDAISAADEFQPDACLLDIGLPDIDGYNVAQTIRSKKPEMLLIALSGWGQEEDRRRSSEAGFNHHLVKPVKIDEVIKLLTELKK